MVHWIQWNCSTAIVVNKADLSIYSSMLVHAQIVLPGRVCLAFVQGNFSIRRNITFGSFSTIKVQMGDCDGFNAIVGGVILLVVVVVLFVCSG